MLVNKLEDIEQQFGCTIMPSHDQQRVLEPLPRDQGLKYSTIGM